MLDLAQPLGTHEGIVFYRDHAQPNLIYYLPDEVSLSTRDLSSGEEEIPAYEFFLQIFKEGQAVKGDLSALEKSAGSILSLGVQCSVSPERLNKAQQKVQARLDLEEELIFSPPVWKDGKIDLILLDATTQDEKTLEANDFVDSILGSKKPSLYSGHLEAVFNARLDRKGTALMAAALQGDRAPVAGVLYELKFEALRPALDLRIRADLDRCHEKISHIIGAEVGFTIYGVAIKLETELKFITEKLEEDGDIEVEVLSQVSDPETQRLIRETVEEFKDKIIRELFRPMVNAGSLPDIDLGLDEAVPKIGVSYVFSKEKKFHQKVIELDYRERSTSVRIHNPQAHLWIFGAQIQSQLDRYVQTVTFSDLWRENTVRVSLLHDFSQKDEDLVSAEVVIWAKKYGKTSPNPVFGLPSEAEAIGHFVFSEQNATPQAFSWISEKDEPVGYYYQVKLTYHPNHQQISSPLEIVSEIITSSSQDLPIIPTVLAPIYIMETRMGNINYNQIPSVDVILRAKSAEGEFIEQEIITLNQESPAGQWRIRRPSWEQIYLEETRQYYLAESQVPLKTAPVLLTDNESIINRPFVDISLTPVIIGNYQKIKDIFIQLSYQPEVGDAYFFRESLRVSPPHLLLEDVKVSVLNLNDKVSWRSQVFTTDGQYLDLAEGETGAGVFLVDLNLINSGNFMIHWEGPSPTEASLDYLRLEFKLFQADGTNQNLPSVEFSGSTVDTPLSQAFSTDGQLYMRILKRFLNGRKKKGRYIQIDSKEIRVSASSE